MTDNHGEALMLDPVETTTAYDSEKSELTITTTTSTTVTVQVADELADELNAQTENEGETIDNPNIHLGIAGTRLIAIGDASRNEFEIEDEEAAVLSEHVLDPLPASEMLLDLAEAARVQAAAHGEGTEHENRSPENARAIGENMGAAEAYEFAAKLLEDCQEKPMISPRLNS